MTHNKKLPWPWSQNLTRSGTKSALPRCWATGDRGWCSYDRRRCTSASGTPGRISWWWSSSSPVCKLLPGTDRWWKRRFSGSLGTRSGTVWGAYSGFGTSRPFVAFFFWDSINAYFLRRLGQDRLACTWISSCKRSCRNWNRLFLFSRSGRVLFCLCPCGWWFALFVFLLLWF